MNVNVFSNNVDLKINLEPYDLNDLDFSNLKYPSFDPEPVARAPIFVPRLLADIKIDLEPYSLDGVDLSDLEYPSIMPEHVVHAPIFVPKLPSDIRAPIFVPRPPSQISEKKDPILAPFLDLLTETSHCVEHLETVAHHNGLVEDFLKIISKTEKDVMSYFDLGILSTDIVTNSLAVIILAAKLALLNDESLRHKAFYEIIETLSTGLPEDAGEIIEFLLEFELVPELTLLAESAEVLGILGALISTGFKSHHYVVHDLKPAIRLEKKIAEAKRELKQIKQTSRNEPLICMVQTRYDCLKITGRIHKTMSCMTNGLNLLTGPLKISMLILALTGVGNVLNIGLFGPLYSILQIPTLASRSIFRWKLYLDKIKSVPYKVQRQWTLSRIKREIKSDHGNRTLSRRDLQKFVRLDQKIEKIRKRSQRRHVAWVLGVSERQIDNFKRITEGMLNEVNSRTGVRNGEEFEDYFRSIRNETFEENPVETIITHMFDLKLIGLI